VLQVARLTHNRAVQNNPLAVRDLLERTGTPVPDVSQADIPLHVGPQLDIGRAVTTLFGRTSPGVAASRSSNASHSVRSAARS